jgi:hypothetical protein
VSCMEVAYDQIKNRKGILLANGVFVKEKWKPLMTWLSEV